MKNIAIGLLALASLSGFTRASAQQNGHVIVDNKSDQFVRVLIDSRAVNGNELQEASIWYSFEPSESSRLFVNNQKLIASNVGYRCVTAAGSSPADRSKVWVTGERAKNGALVIEITNKSLPVRNEKREAVRAAWAVIESQTAAVMMAAHPTATDLEASYESAWDVRHHGQRAAGRFGLTYKYTWRSGVFDDKHWTRLDFFFDQNGKISDIRPASDKPGATSALFAPFAGSDLLVELLEKEILSSEEVKHNRTFGPLVREAAARNDACSMLELWIRLCQES